MASLTNWPTRRLTVIGKPKSFKVVLVAYAICKLVGSLRLSSKSQKKKSSAVLARQTFLGILNHEKEISYS